MLNKNSLSNKSLIGLLVIFLGVSFMNLTAGEDFAEKVKLPKNMKNRLMWESVVKKWKVPSTSEVGVPAFPGAVIVGSKELSHMTANGEKYSTLPTIVLASKKGKEEVLKFYKDKLKDWKYKNDFGMFDIFWKGADKFNSMDIRQTSITPNVNIMKAAMPYTDYKPDAKTVITIVYKSLK